MEYVGNILYDKKLLDTSRRFIIFGTGIYGHRILNFMDLNGVKRNIVCFCDSNIVKSGQYIEGIPVCWVNDAIAQYSGTEFLIAGKYVREMYRTLNENFIGKIHILLI
ncbi:hypothetical protein NSB25_19270 [Acetatifactor muris]|jgi:FlaA1/EpsC-like NDP-sugar epimerase|uniref:PglD N-terminal domain-containing protein n=1 Tax=Acetatifactor muris TaxID=879566 RepID=A0A2K4ZES3_9FIRM|nr:hypothetical protein [Acetatifactor muris]MCI8801088.1 hypothetical protein [Lachnospiraceae bacterium]MCR2049405.1 hypothetical protein [Acetatifactor muris]SOY28961.1 hypothetical protein AMURIS_01676 [Acetatifactor muris]